MSCSNNYLQAWAHVELTRPGVHLADDEDRHTQSPNFAGQVGGREKLQKQQAGPRL